MDVEYLVFEENVKSRVGLVYDAAVSCEYV